MMCSQRTSLMLAIVIGIHIEYQLLMSAPPASHIVGSTALCTGSARFATKSVDQGITRQSASAYASLIVLVWKKERFFALMHRL